MAFAQREPATAFLELAGSQGLPLVLVDGVTVQTGRYLDRAQLAKWAGLVAAPSGITLLGLTENGHHRAARAAVCGRANVPDRTPLKLTP